MSYHLATLSWLDDVATSDVSKSVTSRCLEGWIEGMARLGTQNVPTSHKLSRVHLWDEITTGNLKFRQPRSKFNTMVPWVRGRVHKVNKKIDFGHRYLRGVNERVHKFFTSIPSAGLSGSSKKYRQVLQVTLTRSWTVTIKIFHFNDKLLAIIWDEGENFNSPLMILLVRQGVNRSTGVNELMPTYSMRSRTSFSFSFSFFRIESRPMFEFPAELRFPWDVTQTWSHNFLYAISPIWPEFYLRLCLHFLIKAFDIRFDATI